MAAAVTAAAEAMVVVTEADFQEPFLLWIRLGSYLPMAAAVRKRSRIKPR